MSMINPDNTKAILIGVSEFQDESFIDALPIKNNVSKLQELFLDKNIIGLSKNDILVLDKNESDADILDSIDKFINKDKRIPDTVIFYFAGHGYKDDDGSFYLVTNNSKKNRIKRSSIAWEEIRDKFESGSGIQQRLYILDACHSGAAELGDKDEVMELEDGSVLLAAAKATSSSFFNASDKYTYFTESLIKILEEGIESIEKSYLHLKPICEELRQKLRSKNFKVTYKSTDKIDNVTFFRNIGFHSFVIHLNQARQYFEQGNYKEAIEKFSLAIGESTRSRIDPRKIEKITEEAENAELHLKIKNKLFHNFDQTIKQETIKFQSQIDQLLKEKEKLANELKTKTSAP